MEFEVVLSPRARLDLFEIGRYLEEESAGGAERFCDKLQAAAITLRTFPERHTELKTGTNVRKVAFGSYLLLYRVNRATAKVEILRFWNGFQDRERLRLKEQASVY